MQKLLLFVMLITLFACSSRPVIIAHRGAPGYLPEHTLPSAAYAHALKVDYIEPDLVLTKDNQLIVLHDIHLENTTNVEKVFPKRKRSDGHYYAIDFTLKEIKRLSVHERSKGNKAVFSSRFPTYFKFLKVPSFDEFVDLVLGLNTSTNTKIGIYPELKRPKFHLKNKKDITKVFVRYLESKSISTKLPIIVQSFDPDCLRELNEKIDLPLIQLIADDKWDNTGILFEKMRTPDGLKLISEYADGVGVYIPHLLNEKNLNKDIKAAGLKTHVYTHRADALPKGYKDSKQLWSTLQNLGIDGIFSDHPDKLLNL